jgi:hypothetical protein
MDAQSRSVMRRKAIQDPQRFAEEMIQGMDDYLKVVADRDRLAARLAEVERERDRLRGACEAAKEAIEGYFDRLEQAGCESWIDPSILVRLAAVLAPPAEGGGE